MIVSARYFCLLVEALSGRFVRAGVMKPVRLAIIALIPTVVTSARGSESPITWPPNWPPKIHDYAELNTNAAFTGKHDPRSAAVDAKGVRHPGNEYNGKPLPWLSDRLQSCTPEYPRSERALLHEGQGWFRLTLELGSGRVIKVTRLQSTGFGMLDLRAIECLQQ
jgi:hypothetical protein